MTPADYNAFDHWIDAHFDEEVRFLQELVRVPTDTPPGNNAPHALRTAALLKEFGFDAESHAVPAADAKAAGLESITNLVVRRRYGAGRTVGLNAHGDVVPPGEGWTHDPYGGEVAGGKLYGRASAVSKCDFSTYTFATRAIESMKAQLKGGVELYFTYDEEFGGELGPGWLLQQGLIKPDLLIAAGFSYQVVTGHNGCLQMEVTVHGKMGHAAVPHTAVDALQAATLILNALYQQNTLNKQVTSKVKGITHPYLNVGEIHVKNSPGITIDIKRLLLANALKPLPGNQPLVQALCQHASSVFGEPIEASGTPLYTDARLFSERGIPAVLYGCGPRTVLESNAKRADEHIELDDLRRATKVVARALADLLS
jgi:succinyl-diaminopimelate desuccinylase